MLKRLVLLGGILMLAFHPMISQQQRFLPKKDIWVIKTDAVSLFYNYYIKANGGTLTVERSLCERSTVQLTGKYVNHKNESLFAWALMPEFKCYLDKSGNYEGFYMGSYLKFENRSEKAFMISEQGRGHYIEKTLTWGAGVLSGYQVYMMDDLTIDILLGFGLKYMSNTGRFDNNAYRKNDVKTNHTGPDARFSLNLGYRF
jgi:hypothetical protein